MYWIMGRVCGGNVEPRRQSLSNCFSPFWRASTKASQKICCRNSEWNNCGLKINQTYFYAALAAPNFEKGNWMRSESSVKFYIYIWPCAIIGLIMLFPQMTWHLNFAVGALPKPSRWAVIDNKNESPTKGVYQKPLVRVYCIMYSINLFLSCNVSWSLQVFEFDPATTAALSSLFDKLFLKKCWWGTSFCKHIWPAASVLCHVFPCARHTKDG